MASPRVLIVSSFATGWAKDALQQQLRSFVMEFRARCRDTTWMFSRPYRSDAERDPDNCLYGWITERWWWSAMLHPHVDPDPKDNWQTFMKNTREHGLPGTDLAVIAEPTLDDSYSALTNVVRIAARRTGIPVVVMRADAEEHRVVTNVIQ